jgi:hypothetical protein
MDVVDAMTMTQPAGVTHRDEQEDPLQRFFRQFLDY